jgi:diguanylate cyclase (GGDEF)-like protein
MTVTFEPKSALGTGAQPRHWLPTELVAASHLESLGPVLDLVGHPMLICCLSSRRIIAASPPACRLAAHESHSLSGKLLWDWGEAAFGEQTASCIDQSLSARSAFSAPARRLTARNGQPYDWQWRPIGPPELEPRLAVLAFYECRGTAHAETWVPVYRRDELTGLAGRGALFRWAGESAERFQDGSWCAVFFLDLDNFKAINDQFGHLVGDRVLRTVAQRLAGSLRPGDLVVRYGGDEFVAVVAGIDTPHEADGIASRIAAALAQPIDLDERPDSTGQQNQTKIIVGVSLGVSLAQGKFDFESLLDDADRSMYRAKARTCGFPPR